MKPNQMTTKQFSLWLGEVLQPEKKCRYCWHFTKPSCGYGQGNCSHTNGQGMADCDQSPCKYYHKDPIPLDDWNVAMKFFREASKECTEELLTAMVAIFLREIDDDTDTASAIAHLTISEVEANASAWFVHFGLPKHFLEAAAKCKENNG